MSATPAMPMVASMISLFCLNPRAQAPKVVYVGDTWLERAKADFAAASSELGKPSPEVVGIPVGRKVRCGDITITSLPGNHATKDDSEQTLIYLIEKGSVRVLYATDTGGIPVRAARLVGIYAHIAESDL